jgi:hypothetical protein
MSSEMRLTRAQKWDLARIAAAALVSTAFISVPMFIVRARSATADTRATAPSVTVSHETAIAGVSEPVATTPVQTQAARPPHSDMVEVVTSTELAQVTRPVGTPGRTIGQVRPVQVRARAQTRDEPRQPTKLSRRLARFIAGDGKHGPPKPFPTVSTSGM